MMRLRGHFLINGRSIKAIVVPRSISISKSKRQPINRAILIIGRPILINFGHVRIPFGVPSKYGEPGIKSSRALNDNFD